MAEPNGLWRVVAQRVIPDVLPNGQFIDVMEVTIQTTSGATVPMKIPLDGYNAEAVAGLANAYADEVETVAGLGNG